MIEAKGLVKTYHDGEREIRPLDGTDFTCRYWRVCPYRGQIRVR